MRSFSTPESAVKGEITKLAVVECFFSIVIYVAIGYYRHTFTHYVWAIAVAPFLLFRSEQSSLWGLAVSTRFLHSLQAKFGDGGGSALALVLAPIHAVIVRFVGTLYWLFRQPVSTISEMPSNWIRQSLCTDFSHPPEILPLELTRGNMNDNLLFSDLLGGFRLESGILLNAMLVLASLPIVLLGYIPALLYRISFKATALVYAPFVLVTHTSLRSTLTIKTRLERFTKGEMEKVRRALAVFILSTAALKLGLVLGWFDLGQLLARIPSPKLVNGIVEPTRFPWWQGTLVIDALLTYILFFFADAALARLEEKAWPETVVLGTISGITLVRNVLAILTVSSFCYLAIREVANSGLIKFRF
jgi:hypothetical protein